MRSNLIRARKDTNLLPATAGRWEIGRAHASQRSLALALFALFLAAPATAQSTTGAITVPDAPSLRKAVTLSLEDAPLAVALDEIARQSGLTLSWVPDLLPSDARVTLRAERVPAGEALTRVLEGTGLEARARSGAVTLVRRPPPPQPAVEPEPRAATITGRVTEAETDTPILNAQVAVDGAGRAITDADGRFRIPDIPPGVRTVSVTSIGYRSVIREVEVTDGDTVTVDFVLEVSPTSLDEVVVTVTGEQRRREVGNVVGSIRADSLMQVAPIMTFGDLIQGRAPGVLSMTTPSNMTGQAGIIRIRGLNSFNLPNDPIVVVDGVRVEASGGSGFFASPASSTTGGYTGRLADLDPTEIASVEVAKGPAAATLYGTDAANGVLVITTKRGQPGRTRWTGFTEQGLLQQRMDYADQYPDFYYAFGHSTTTGAPQRCTLAQRAAGSCVLDSLTSYNTFTDPATKPFKDSYRQQYGLQLSGGSAGGTTYFLSGDYQRETGTTYMPVIDQTLIQMTQGRAVPDWQVRPNGFAKVNLRANLTVPLGSRGSATLATGFVSNQARQPANGIPFYQTGNRGINAGWIGPPQADRPAYVFAYHGEDVVRRFTASFATSYHARDWLALRGTVGADLSTNNYGVLARRGEAWDNDGTLISGSRIANGLDVARYSLDLGATATHALSAAVSSKTSVGVQYNRRTQRGTRIQASNLPLGGETLAGGTVLTGFFGPVEATLATAVAGGYIEEQLAFRDRLFLTGAVRFDGGSAFGQDFALTAYPKASLSWLVSDGQGAPHLPGVSSLRLRVAYGASGVQPAPTAALALLDVTSGLNIDGTAAVPGATLSSIGNPDLKPERTSEVEAGFDLELAASRVRLEFTAYQRTTHDALVNRPLALSIGGSGRWENIGSVRNRGLELMLNADLVRGRAVAAGFTLTGALMENRLLALAPGVQVSSPIAEGHRQDVGYPLYALWGRSVESYADANGNGIIELSEVTIGSNHYIGPTFPTREATVAPYLGLWGDRLHLSASMQYRGGFYTSDFARAQSCVLGFGCRAINDISTPLAEQARSVVYANTFSRGSFAESASYFLLREMSLGLAVPLAVTRAIGARAGSVVLAGRNLAVLWKASRIPIENGGVSRETNDASIGAGPSTYWLLRVNVNY